MIDGSGSSAHQSGEKRNVAVIPYRHESRRLGSPNREQGAMSRFSPHSSRVSVVTIAATDDAWLVSRVADWQTSDVRYVSLGTAASSDIRSPDLVLMVLGSAVPTDEEQQAAARVATSAGEQGALVVALLAGQSNLQRPFFAWQDTLHGVVEVVAPAMLEEALAALLRIVVMPGVMRLEIEDLEAFFEGQSQARLSLGKGYGEARAEQATVAPHAEALTSPEGRWLVGLLTDGSLGVSEFNAVGAWLQERVAADHEITAMAGCDEAMGDVCQVMVMASS
jgi:hypothetical protein